MQRKPRNPKEKIFNPQMISQTIIAGLTMGVIAFVFWVYLVETQMMDETNARNIILLLMVLLQNVHAFNCRSELSSTFLVPLRRNYLLVFGVLLAQGLHILSMHIPFMQHILRVEPITYSEWLTALALAVPLLIVMELYKLIYKRLSRVDRGE